MKALFFDIDGTIWNRQNYIPESTRKAFEILRQNGHKTFINTGRSMAYIQYDPLLSLGFDGIISGCGTMIEYNGNILKEEKIDLSLLEHSILIARKYGFRPILEGKDYLYMDESEFGQDPYGMKLKRELGDRLLTIEDEWGKWDVCKFACDMTGADKEGCFRALEPYYDFMVHNDYVVEIVPKGNHKGQGIVEVCNYLGINVEDSYAFGDGANDIGMFKAAGTAVAMGNASEIAKEHADYVTTTLEEDGIWNACKYFGLL